MVRVTDEEVEVVARALCRNIGDDPDLEMSGGELRWKWLEPHARAAITALDAYREEKA